MVQFLFIPSFSLFWWDTLAWPRKIFDQIDITENQMEQDEQKFHKKLIDDQTQLEDKLDTLQVSNNSIFMLLYIHQLEWESCNLVIV